MTTMIERVARAIAGADPEQQGQIDDSEMGEYFWEKYREHYLPLARAAIEAMREPTPDMISAGIKREVAWEYGERGDWDDESGPHVPSHAAYQSMIDAALNEQVSG